MNILPKKSWHVRNPDNKERVRRDEENARLQEKREHERIGIAEKEARIAYLRKKNNIVCDGNASGIVITAEPDTVGGHLNLFSTEEDAGSSGVKKDNEEYVREKHAEKEKEEKRIGLLTYVGQSELEAKKEGKQLWYLEKPQKKKEKRCGERESSDSEVDEPKKSKLDPIAVIEKHTSHKRTKKEHKKRKKKKKEKMETSSSSSSKKSIEVLREERLKREKAEKLRTEALLCGNETVEQSEDAKIGNDRNKYFSQFNPQLARKKGH